MNLLGMDGLAILAAAQLAFVVVAMAYFIGRQHGWDDRGS